jgi:metal-responsive CopG/Arc/MetJ family transcriptional regulator
MRTLVDIPDDQLAELSEIARTEKTSRAALVRRAVAEMLASHRSNREDPIAAAFGLWGESGEDGLAYQERLRAEWSERS